MENIKYFHNEVILTGRLTRKPETRELNSGKRINNFTLATPLRHITANSWDTGYFAVVAWDQLAGDMSLYFDQGDKITVKGRLNFRKYKDKDGNSRSITEIIANEVYIDTLKNPPEFEEENKRKEE